MLRRIEDMPAGTIGFEARGEVEDDDWEHVVEPVLRDEIADGRKVRLLYVLGRESGDVEGDAMTSDVGFRARQGARLPGSRPDRGQGVARRLSR